MKVAVKSLVSLMVLLILNAGCSSIPQEHRGAAKGAGIGAATGAVAGAVLAGDKTEGALLGGLAGALIGGAVGHYTVDKEKNAEETAQDYNYRPSEGTRVRIEETSVDPEVVRAGDKVEIESKYAVLSPNSDEQVKVSEAFEIRHNGELVGNPQATVSHDPGTYNASVPLFLPENAKSGTYEVVTTISAAGTRDRSVTTFEVR